MAFWEMTLGGLIGSGVATTIIGTLLARRNAKQVAEVKQFFDERMHAFTITRAYRQAALYELFGPLKMQFARTRRAFNRWKCPSDHIEGQVIRQANLAARDLLLAKGHLIPPHLIDAAESLIEHYDAWLEKYERLRITHPDPDAPFVFTGPDGYGFPRKAEEAVGTYTKELQEDLFGLSRASG